jgi:hypothetical protein
MATEKQVQANRNNAKKSTGPRTGEGKARASQNALKHGLLANGAVLPGEDPVEFEAQLAALEDAIQPGDALEHELVRQIADAQWRLRRLSRLETAYLIAALDNTRDIEAVRHPRPLHYSEEENTLMLGYTLMGRTQTLANLARYDAHLGRRFERAIQQIARLREAREKRQAAQAKQANSAIHRPAGPANGADTRPLNGTPPHTPHTAEPQPPASEAINQTKPNSPNHNKSNDLAPAARAQSHPAPAISQQVPLQPALGESRHCHNISASPETNHPRGPIPNQN